MARQPNFVPEHIIRFLMPFFTDGGVDVGVARSEILDTLIAYGARTRCELLNAAQIIAFGMSTLETLAEAKATEMSPSLRLRFRGCANGLNRAGHQNEKALAHRIACDKPAVEPPQEPVNGCSDAEATRIRHQTPAKIDTIRSYPPALAAPGVPVMTAARTERNKRLWGAAMRDAFGQLGLSTGPAPEAHPAQAA